MGNVSRGEKAVFKQRSIGTNKNVNKILRTKAIIAGLIAGVTFIVFLPALQNEFLNWDDDKYVYENSFIRSLDTQLLKSAFLEFHASNWHPLTWLSHALDYAIWGLNPLGHHLTNNILHSLNALLVVLFVMRFMEVYKETSGDKELWQSFSNYRAVGATGAVAGALFGLHPLHVESVAWVAERKDLLCAFFFLLSLLMYIGYAAASSGPGRPFRRRLYLLTLGFFTLALLSKPMAVTLPFILMMLDWCPFKKIQSLKMFWRAFVEKLPFFALTVIASMLTFLAQKTGGAMEMMQHVPLSTRVLVGARSVISYLGKMIVPVNLVPYYPYPENVSLLSLQYFSSIVLVIAITLLCVVIAKRQKLWLLAWGYFVITLLPVLGLIQVGNQSMADRYTYLPSLGPFLIIAVMASIINEKLTALSHRRMFLRMAGPSLALGMLMLLSYAAIVQIGIWKDNFIFWSYVVEKEPGGASVAHNNLGIAYASQGQLDRAISEYQTALRLAPSDAKAHYNLGLTYAAQGQLDRAIPEYQTALRLKPDYVDAHNNLGIAYASQGQLGRAILEYQAALQLKPSDAKAHYNLGNAYASQGQLDRAISEYQAALRLKPDYVEVYNNLGNAYASQGQLDRAISEFQTALRLKPDYADVHYNLGNAYASQGQLDRAISEFQIVLRLKPDDYEASRRLNAIASRRH